MRIPTNTHVSEICNLVFIVSEKNLTIKIIRFQPPNQIHKIIEKCRVVPPENSGAGGKWVPYWLIRQNSAEIL